MRQEQLLKVVLGCVGVLFLALAYPMALFVRQGAALSMMLSVYVTLGVFLLLAIRHPGRHRSLIAFAAWSSIVHALWMGAQSLMGMVARVELVGCAVLILIGIVLIALAPEEATSAVSVPRLGADT